MSYASCDLLSLIWLQFCTTAFLVEVAQYMKFGELTGEMLPTMDMDTGMTVPQSPVLQMQLPDKMSFNGEDHFSKDEEDALVISMSTQFADWIAAFLRRVILLFENLPEEGANGAAGGQTEGVFHLRLLSATAEDHIQLTLSMRCVEPSVRSACICRTASTTWY